MERSLFAANNSNSKGKIKTRSKRSESTLWPSQIAPRRPVEIPPELVGSWPGTVTSEIGFRYLPSHLSITLTLYASGR